MVRQILVLELAVSALATVEQTRTVASAKTANVLDKPLGTHPIFIHQSLKMVAPFFLSPICSPLCSLVSSVVHIKLPQRSGRSTEIGEPISTTVSSPMPRVRRTMQLYAHPRQSFLCSSKCMAGVSAVPPRSKTTALRSSTIL